LKQEAKAILIAACTDGQQQGMIVFSFDSVAQHLVCGGRRFPLRHTDRRAQARYKKALQQLQGCKLIEDTGDRSGPGGNLLGRWTVQYDGYLVADQLLTTEETENPRQNGGQG